MITIVEVRDAIDQLSRIYALPERAKANLDLFVRIWHDALAPLTPAQLASTVRFYLASDETYFPKPGKFKWIAQTQFREEFAPPADLAAQYRAWEAAGCKRHPLAVGHCPCPVCGAEVGYYVVNLATGAERLFVLHHADRHHQAGIKFVGRAAVGSGGGDAEWAPPKPPAAAEVAHA